MYGSQYLKDELLDAAGRVHDEAEKDGLTGHAVALRWVLHHSALDAAHGDAMILGASSMKQLEENLEITKAGPLPKHLVELVEDVWQPAKPFAPFAHVSHFMSDFLGCGLADSFTDLSTKGFLLPTG